MSVKWMTIPFLLAASHVVDASYQCEKLDAVYADIHDGDQKRIIISGGTLTIVPHGNNETWQVVTSIDPNFCNASIDFNVPGKPSPPPVNLTATLFWSTILLPIGAAMKTEFEFTDPTGKLAAPDFPLNRWVQLNHPVPQEDHDGQWPDKFDAVFADMHDGDQKHVTLSGTSLIITPHGNKQSWMAHATVDRKIGKASIDFNVPGKPGPPPVNLTATWLVSASIPLGLRMKYRIEFEFTDPSGTLAPADFPLNHWAQLIPSGPEKNVIV
eukprot:TRINITY_DN43352_c0_g1_i1.p1 TRINITY_DN43352_c0_g1~~TRINITY_DN43352_c0_g1_i1.p1  ORF type:complete len:293 (+),score=33.64 TRINITY_DN43352_c0_g1_i1:75-881(+)